MIEIAALVRQARLRGGRWVRAARRSSAGRTGRVRRLPLRSCLEPQLLAAAGRRYFSPRRIARRGQPTPSNLVTLNLLGKGLSVPPFVACSVGSSFFPWRIACQAIDRPT